MLLLSFGGTLSVSDESLASQLGTLEITDDSPVINLSVDDRAAVAFAQRFQRLGIRLDYDRGDGTMVTFPGHLELGDTLTINESADSFGDVLTFKLMGAKFSRFARAWVASKAKIEVYFTVGSPLHEFSAKVFTGWIVSASYDVQPPSVTVTALDAAGLYAEKRAKDWSLPPNSGRTWLDITQELLGIGGIPAGVLDFGGNGGGIANKPHTLGDRPIIVFLRDALGAKCIEVGFEDGKFVARRYDPTLPPVLELNPGNMMLPASLSWPETLAPNILGVVSLSSTRTEPVGLRTTPEECVITTGPYAPKSAAGSYPTNIQPIAKVCTSTTFLGSLDVHMEQTTWGWYAVLAAGAQIQPVVGEPGEWEVVPTLSTVYVYPDGTTRADPVEQFRRTGKIVRDKYVDANLNVVRKTEGRYFFHFLRQAPFLVVDGEDELQTVTSFPVNDDGQAVIGGREVMGLLIGDDGNTMEGGLPASSIFQRPDAFTETDYTLNADGAIIEEVTREHTYDIGQSRRRANGAWGYGVESITYTDRPAESYIGAADPWGGLKITTKRYRAIDEDRYEMSVETRIGAGAPTTEAPLQFIGSLPRPERAEPTQSSQEIRAVFEDHERIALAGEEIESIEHNEFVETPAEALALARHRARLASAVKFSGPMPLDVLLHKWRMIRLNVPGAAIENLHFYVRSVSRDAPSFSQTITADYYAPGIG